MVLLACERESSPPPQQPVYYGNAGNTFLPPAPPPPGATSGSPGCQKPARTGALTGQRVPVFGKNRTYTLVVPDGYQPGAAYPLVFGLHGHGGNGAGVRAQLDLERAAQGKAIFVYPDGIGGGWDLDSPAAKNGDVALFDAILAVAQSSLCVDLRRVFV